MTCNVPTPDGWKRVASHAASRLRDGDVLAVQGPLGAGKTTFVQALARALGAARTPKSPTFSMLRAYAINKNGLKRLLHVDAYRIVNEADLLPLDLDEELLVPGTVMAVEWPENMPALLGRRKTHVLTIEIRGKGRRARFVEAG
jgi:tRNA threonylcarbamoyladenosine biosynthesis protein TsaE